VKAREFVFDEYKQKSLDTMVEKYFFLTNSNERKITSYKTTDRTGRIWRI
jgi:hypothetical protein